MTSLVLEFLNAREVDPLRLLRLAVANDIDRIAICINPFRALTGSDMPFGDLPDWDLIGDTVNRRALRQACRTEGVAIDSADVFVVGPETDVEAYRPWLESAEYLGAEWITIIPVDPDRNRLTETTARFCDIAGEHGLGILHENSLRMTNHTLAEALAFQRATGRDNIRISLDALHSYRAKTTSEEIALLTKADVGRIQINDTSEAGPEQGGGYEAFYQRMIPGQGDIPLDEFVKAMPDGVPVGFEVPLWKEQQAGMEPSERVRRIVSAGRRLLEANGRI